LKKTSNVNTINFMPTKPAALVKSPSYHHGNLRDTLLSAAIDVMAEKGVSQFSLSELARGAGVTPAAAYKHFVDKDALLGELAQRGFALLRLRFEAAATKSKPAINAKQAIQRFERIGNAYLEFGQEEPALFHLIFGKGASAFRKKMASSVDRTPTFAYFAEALEDLYKFGVIAKTPSPNDQWFAWSAIHGATELAIAGVSRLVKPEQTAKVITSTVLKALR
jgi:AcrR family transcriptional regulator